MMKMPTKMVTGFVVVLVVGILLFVVYTSRDTESDLYSTSYRACTLDEEGAIERTIVISSEHSLDSNVNAFELDGSPFEGGIPPGEAIPNSESGGFTFISEEWRLNTRIPITKDCIQITEKDVQRLRNKHGTF